MQVNIINYKIQSDQDDLWNTMQYSMITKGEYDKTIDDYNDTIAAIEHK